GVAACGVFCVALAACGGSGGESAPAPASGESLQTILMHADASFRDGDYGEAQKAYEQAVAIDPDQSRATVNLATCYLKNRLVKKAQDLLQAFLGRHPDDPAARLQLGRTLVRQGELAAAAEALRRV